MADEKDRPIRVSIDADADARLNYIRKELGLTSRAEALNLAIVSAYENLVESKMMEIDPLLPITVRLDEISAKLDLVLPDF